MFPTVEAANGKRMRGNYISYSISGKAKSFYNGEG